MSAAYIYGNIDVSGGCACRDFMHFLLVRMIPGSLGSMLMLLVFLASLVSVEMELS